MLDCPERMNTLIGLPFCTSSAIAVNAIIVNAHNDAVTQQMWLSCFLVTMVLVFEFVALLQLQIRHKIHCGRGRAELLADDLA